MPLTLIGLFLRSVCLAGFLFFTVSFPAPTNSEFCRYSQDNPATAQARHSNHLAVGEPLAFGALNALNKSGPVRYFGVIPTESKLVSILWHVPAAARIDKHIQKPDDGGAIWVLTGRMLHKAFTSESPG